MFQVRIHLTELYVEGLRALDERRRLGFEDDTVLSTTDTYMACDITEQVARQFPDAFATSSWASCEVTLSQLCPDDVAIGNNLQQNYEGEPGHYVHLRKDLSAQRVFELLHSAKWLFED